MQMEAKQIWSSNPHIRKKIDLKIKKIVRDKEGTLHNDQGINPRGRLNNYTVHST